jgi:alcohol dehydrogenase
VNLVRLPETIDDVTAASLGCRFVTSFRAVVDQARVSAGQWVAVHGCGGVGLSAIMIASAQGAHVIAVDISPEKLALASSLGACATVDARSADVVKTIVELSAGGAHASIDALGSPATCFNSVACLRKRGRHVQVGLMLGDHHHPAVPMDMVIAKELEIVGSHGMQAHRYPAMLGMINAGTLQPKKLIGKTITLDQAADELADMDSFKGTGVTVVDRFA